MTWLCPDCERDVERGVCPECGRAYDPRVGAVRLGFGSGDSVVIKMDARRLHRELDKAARALERFRRPPQT